MLRVALAALTPRVYGQAAFLDGILPRLARVRNTKFFVITSEPPGALRFETGNLELIHCRPPRKAGWARVLWEQAALPRLMLQLGIDVYYSPNNIAVLRSPRPCVIHVRNLEPLTAAAPGMPAGLRVRLALLRFLTRRSLMSARRVVAASTLVRRIVIAMGCAEEKVAVIYHGVDDLKAPQAGAGSRGGYLAAAAKFVRYANLGTLIRGFVRARELGYGGELRVAGGPHDRRYEAEIRRLIGTVGAAASAIRFLGYIGRDQLLSLMRECEAFVFPSTLEACPFTMLEAMRQGAPIIATTAPPMPEFGGDAPIYVEPRDPQALGAAIHRVSSCPRQQMTMRVRSAARAQEFCWDNAVTQLLEVLNQAASGA